MNLGTQPLLRGQQQPSRETPRAQAERMTEVLGHDPRRQYRRF
jgi:hypothetical protein